MTVTEEQVAAEVKSVLDDELDPWLALDLDDAESVTGSHVQTTISSRYVPVERAGHESRQAFRLTTRPVADTISNARELNRGCEVALRGTVLAVGGETSTPVKRESADPIGADEDMFSGLTTWTFTF